MVTKDIPDSLTEVYNGATKMTKHRLQALDRLRDMATMNMPDKDVRRLDRDYVILIEAITKLREYEENNRKKAVLLGGDG